MDVGVHVDAVALQVAGEAGREGALGRVEGVVTGAGEMLGEVGEGGEREAGRVRGGEAAADWQRAAPGVQLEAGEALSRRRC
ncbi:MAG: hypothetical protein IPO88_20190 [Nannocystis sp.]|uniref:hypothetical protein n=1 Tax=Nannocystis sp. TaxID=1962667 RepID=UPI0024274F50|nr:hypothetical protein [Nannocystis sp.]MBK9755784.1 hypothetical protein [Nannocystis sp.]